MSLLLAGGGLGPGTREALDRFVRSARERAERAPQLVVLADGDPTAELVGVLERAGAGRVDVYAAPGPEVPEATSDAAREALLRADGVLLVGTSAVPLLGLVREAVVDLRRLVSEEVPFVGIAAGAAVAGQSAVLGGTVLDGVRLAPSAADEPAEVAVVAGLGLVDVTIDTGGAAAGLLGRVLALVESGTVDRALVIDEDTVLAVADGSLDVFGTGSVWQARLADNGEVVVSSAHHGIES
ncbi:hypothetical protein F8O01_12375 [Pseudoclavibacter chungangensis]|uniref:Cyanophycinase n=1 Tax=Pseudoclavibacter chungangensis TaxID=587635 RepID=A0A7J5BRT3_9MICO|nr:hypothetical protein [Pseudoclavibacter chungangensis]KAB1655056.1 hypothetical protein F8O01_12375 [Pseudoclavibacter chungangensis]NYJ66182.1 cyanophycinase [Pseudoclavibacter chungangensis]